MNYYFTYSDKNYIHIAERLFKTLQAHSSCKIIYYTINFDYENNFFTKLLSEYYNIQIVKPEDNPDILFYSIFGDNHKQLTAKRKIFYSGESVSQRYDVDFNITFDNDNDNNCRLPLWLCYLNDEIIDDFNNFVFNN
mgnify:CR=1 FL=1